MRRRHTLFACLLVSGFLGTPLAPATAASLPRPDFSISAPADPDNVIVRFKATASDAKIEKLEKSHKLVESEELDHDGTVVYEVGTNETPATVAQKLYASGTVEFAEPDYTLRIDAATNDTFIDRVWGVQNRGQSVQNVTGINGIDANVLPAWNGANGNGIVVGVLDEGVDINHPELASHIFTNTSDCDNDAVDDDANGYVDDCHGWDFYHNDNSPFDAADSDDHGTHVAGTIAASANNNLGVAGVAPNATILPLKFLGPAGGSTSDAIRAISYAQDKGVKIINCSWGGSGYSQALKDAMANSGIFFAVASGNDGYNLGSTPQYPASFDLPNIVTVAAIDNRGALASFSNYGGNTTVAAPGVDIYSTMPRKLATSVAVENRNASSTWMTAYWGFGLESVVGAANRRELLKTELQRMGANASSPILLIDDDESSSGSSATPDTRSYYAAALAAAGYNNVSVYEIPKGASGPSSGSLAGNYVIWETGYAVGSASINTLTGSDLANLNAYVTGGGKLILSGADAIWRNETANFVTSTLGATFFSEGDSRTTANGVGGTVFAGQSFSINGSESPFGSINAYQDTVTPTGAFAVSVLNLPADADYSVAYGFKSGTSMAAPHVAGVAALVLQSASSANATTIASFIKDGVRKLPSVGSGKTITGGIVDAGQSVALASGNIGGAAGTQQQPVAAATGGGYRFVASDGGIFAYGNSTFQGSAGGGALNKPVVAMAATPSGNGYWLVASDGGIFSYGDAAFLGSTGGTKLNQPIVGMASTPTGKGYWLVASDGGIFAYGDASFFGSTGAIKLNKPIVGMSSTPSGKGYWLVASDGGIFAYGDATFQGSTGGMSLNKPITGLATSASGKGYWLVANDGGIFAFGDATFHGSAGALKLNAPIIGITTTASGNGYWLVASDGGIFSFGDAAFYGSTGNIKLNKPIVGMSR